MLRDEIVIAQINEIKNSISQFMKELIKYANARNYANLTQSQLNFFEFISKQIIFLKKIYEFEKNYIIKVLISDYYNFIVSIIKNEHRYIYVNERSIIENYTRWITSTDVEKNHITTQVFEVFKSKASISNNEYALIKSAYCQSCGYVHGSRLLNDNLAYVFKECISNIVVFKNPNGYCQTIVRIIKIYNRIIISSYPDLIDGCFFRRKSILQYLIGKENVDLLFSALMQN